MPPRLFFAREGPRRFKRRAVTAQVRRVYCLGASGRCERPMPYTKPATLGENP